MIFCCKNLVEKSGSWGHFFQNAKKWPHESLFCVSKKSDLTSHFFAFQKKLTSWVTFLRFQESFYNAIINAKILQWPWFWKKSKRKSDLVSRKFKVTFFLTWFCENAQKNLHRRTFGQICKKNSDLGLTKMRVTFFCDSILRKSSKKL